MPELLGFCKPEDAPIITKNRRRFYRTPDGDFPSVTTVNKVLGLAGEALIAWSANLERSACLEAATEVFANGDFDGPDGFRSAVEERIGTARQHQVALTKASDIGTVIHAMIQWQLRGEMGLPQGLEPTLPDACQWGYMAWQDWWKASGLKIIATEQPVWDKVHRYAGTIDAVCENEKGQIGVVDFKSSKGIYDEYHIQVAAYMHAARNFSPIEWGLIVRVPKVVTDASFETKPLGNLYKGTLSEKQLREAFFAARTLWGIMVEREAR
jgi:hypothetical protein